MTEVERDGSRPERALVLDMARLSLILGPVLVAVATLFWGVDGLISSVLSFALVLMNLVLGATIAERAAAISLNTLMGAVLGGFVVRLLLLGVIVLPIRNVSWFEVVPFAITLIGGHLGLLTWEARRVSTKIAAAELEPPSARGPLSPSISLRMRSESE